MAVNNVSTILTVAKNIILQQGNKGLHVRDIAQRAMETNQNMQLDLDTFIAKVTAALGSNLKTKDPLFMKVKNPKTKKEMRGVYKVRPKYAPVNPTIQKPKPPAIKSTFAGRAGEYAVASELLFWGYNVLFNAVDEGIDLIADVDNKLHYIQVKTSAFVNETANFKIDTKSFEATKEKQPWYVFVMRDGTKLNYAIIPFFNIDQWRNGKFIGGANALSIQITYDAPSKTFKLCGIDINMFINTFNQFKQ